FVLFRVSSWITLFMFLNSWMLFGLVGVLVPPLVHLISRRRHDVIDWAAMRFLRPKPAARRRLLLEEIILLALRMLFIATPVLGRAAPVWRSRSLARWAHRAHQDVVLVIDGSLSMGYAGGGTAHDAARAWAYAFLDDREPGDAVAV